MLYGENESMKYHLFRCLILFCVARRSLVLCRFTQTLHGIELSLFWRAIITLIIRGDNFFGVSLFLAQYNAIEYLNEYLCESHVGVSATHQLTNETFSIINGHKLNEYLPLYFHSPWELTDTFYTGIGDFISFCVFIHGVTLVHSNRVTRPMFVCIRRSFLFE